MSRTLSEKQLLKRKRIFASFSLFAFLCVLIVLTYFLGLRFARIAKTGEEFRDFIQSYGAMGIFVALGIQIIQVFIALIPGEFVEIGVGYAYGWFYGTLLSLAGVAISSSFIFLLVKKYGIRFVEIFVSTDKINQLKFIRSEEKLRFITFLVFFIPGTPKDLLTYFIGLTRMSLKEFLTLTLFARIPSVASSTVGGNLIVEGRYLGAALLFIVTAVISIGGIYLYNLIIHKLKEKHLKIRKKFEK